MVGQDKYRRTRLVLLALVTAASIAFAAKGGDDKDKGGGKPSGQSGNKGGGAKQSKPAARPEDRGNKGGGAKPAKPSAKPEGRGNNGGGAKPSKPSGQPGGRADRGGGARPGKPSGQPENRGNNGGGAQPGRPPGQPGRAPGQPESRSFNGGGAQPGRPPGPMQVRGYGGGDRQGTPVIRSFAPPRGGYTAWRGRTEAIRPRPVFAERVVVLDQRGWGSGWHNGWRDRPAPQVVISTPHYVWHEAMYVPVQRPFIEMGCQVSFWGGDMGAVVAYEDRELIVVRDSPEVIVVESGIAYPVYWEEPPVIYEEEIYVPVRPAAVSLGLGVVGTGGGLTIAGGFSFSSTW